LIFLLKDVAKDKNASKSAIYYEVGQFFNLMHAGGVGSAINPSQQLDEEMKDQQ